MDNYRPISLLTSISTGDPLHSRALAHSRAPLFTQPCPHCSHSRAPGEQWARLCVFTLQGCVQAARLCRGSPVISKLFEKVVFTQLYDFFHKNQLFYSSQYGFRKLHSTEFAALELTDRILKDIDGRDVSLTIFMDLSKAFDTLDHHIVLKKLNYYGIEGPALNWFSSYLTGRQQYVELDGVSSSFSQLSTGVPQGSILGPLLFLIYMNDIPNASTFFKYVLYADDTTLFSTINISAGATHEINNHISKVYDRLAVNKLSLNVKKTKNM